MPLFCGGREVQYDDFKVVSLDNTIYFFGGYQEKQEKLTPKDHF